MESYQQIANGTVTNPAGFLAAATTCGLKASGNLDLALVYSERNCRTAAVFTQNQVVAAPVIVNRETLAGNRTAIRGIVANAGIANACTGAEGVANTRSMQKVAAFDLGCGPEQILVLSTGIIGVQLPMDRVRAGIETAASELSPANGRRAAEAIMTTDTRPKHLAVQVELAGGVVTIGGMAKGAGMIHPNMATMLAVITTDAVFAPAQLQALLEAAVNRSFNRISVDGDTSPSDTVLLLANGASGVTVADKESIALFARGLNHVCIELAQLIVRDGEGATKFVTIRVSGARSEADAHAIAQTIATSPLVKTAFAGSDPNWGRILAAAGRAGVPFDQNQVSLWIGVGATTGLQLVAQGTPLAYQEEAAAAVFAQPAFVVQLDLGQGKAATTMWTTDLTHDYVGINADYRT